VLLEVRAASRKTPGDGRFEIGETTARRLSAIGETLVVAVDDASETARVEHMACSCDKAGRPGGHEHVFLASPLLKCLTPERTYALELQEDGVVRLTSAHDGLRTGGQST